MASKTLQCRITGKQFDWSDATQKLVAGLGFPPPTLCPEERHRRRLAHRNERRLYRRTCALTKKPTLAIYADEDIPVYSQDAWWSDAWDARTFGRTFDFSRPFFEQFYELKRTVPRLALQNIRAENSDYCNITNSNKNCYLVFGGDYNEDCLFSIFSMYCRDCVDVYWVNESELCYECIDCARCYNLRYSQDCKGCRDSSFLHDCSECRDCFCCVGLTNKAFHYFNEPLSEAEYRRRTESPSLGSWCAVQALKENFEAFLTKFPLRAVHFLSSEACSGNHIANAKNCRNCFDIEGPAEDLDEVYIGGFDGRNLISSDHVGFKGELFYEVMSGIEGYEVAFCCYSWTSSESMYSDFISNSKNLFGCAGMNRAEYCILNKQYDKDEYTALRTKIIAHMKETGEWGEFFPIEHSLFGYNETAAQDIFPETKESAVRNGWRWRDDDLKPASPSPELPDDISEIKRPPEHAVVCEQSGRQFKIIPQELAYYQRNTIPVPRLAPDTRNEARLARRSSLFLWPRRCANCGESIPAGFPNESGIQVVCDRCYLAESTSELSPVISSAHYSAYGPRAQSQLYR